MTIQKQNYCINLQKYNKEVQNNENQIEMEHKVTKKKW